MKNGDIPAMPLAREVSDRFQDGYFDETGLTKREYFAAMAMQGLASALNGTWLRDRQYTAEMAVLYADALLAELEKEQEK
jgi:hypothetical protein